MKEGIWIGSSKRFLMINLVCSLIFLLSSPALAQKTRISIGAAQAGGAVYPIMVGIADLINKFLPGYNAVVMETGGTLENTRLLGKREIQLGASDIRTATQAWNGRPPFSAPLRNLRLGLFEHHSVLHIVTLEKTKIKTVQDLKGRIVSVGAPGSIVTAWMELLLGMHNMSLNDLKLRHLGMSEAMDALADGVIEAAVLFSAPPSSAVNSLAVMQKVRLVTADEKLLKAAEAKEQFLCYFIPPKTYKGQDEGAFTMASISTCYFHDEISNKDAYNIAKVVVEHNDLLEKVHPLGKQMRLVTKRELELSPVPLHPGVLQLAKEKGVSY